MYKALKDVHGNVCADVVLRTTDNACIPFDERNADYKAYLAWLALGNEPLPAE